MKRFTILILALLMPAFAAWGMFPFPSIMLQNSGVGGATAAQVSNFLTQSYTGSCTTFAGCYTFSRASNATMFDSTGTLTYAPNNLLLNSATLSTQSITTTASNYILSIYGTGSVVLSGTNVATLSGTGAGNQVYLAFTPTAGTLTLTVAGSVTSAVLANVTYETTPRSGDQVATGAAAYYGPRFDYPNATAAGLLLEPVAATNLLHGSLINASYNWGTYAPATTVTPNFATAPDGTTSATQVLPTATSNQHAVNNTTFTSTGGATYTISGYLKQGAGSYYAGIGMASAGYVNGFFAYINLSTGAIANSGTTGTGATFISATVTGPYNGYYRLDVVGTPTSASQFFNVSVFNTSSQTPGSLWIGDGTSYVLGWGFGLRAGLDVGDSYIPTIAASATRAAESLTATPVALGWSDSTGTLIVEGTFPPANQLGVIANVQGASLELELQESNAANNAAGQYEGAYASSSTNWIYDSTTNLPAGSPVRAGVQIISGTDYLSANGNALITGSTVGSLSSTSINFGQRNGGTNQLNQLHLRSLGVYSAAMSSVVFRAKTTVGASY